MHTIENYLVMYYNNLHNNLNTFINLHLAQTTLSAATVVAEPFLELAVTTQSLVADALPSSVFPAAGPSSDRLLSPSDYDDIRSFIMSSVLPATNLNANDSTHNSVNDFFP